MPMSRTVGIQSLSSRPQRNPMVPRRSHIVSGERQPSGAHDLTATHCWPRPECA